MRVHVVTGPLEVQRCLVVQSRYVKQGNHRLKSQWGRLSLGVLLAH